MPKKKADNRYTKQDGAAEGHASKALMINQWHLRDKAILADALKEIYAIRGEDAEVAAIVLKALRIGGVPGYETPKDAHEPRK